MCHNLMSLDARSAIKNGIIQLISGILSLAFGLACWFYWMSNIPGYYPVFLPSGPSSIWTGVFIIIGGIVTLLAGSCRSFCCTIAALVFAVVNVWFSVSHFFIVMVAILDGLWSWHCWEWWHNRADCDDRPYPIMMVLASILMLAAFAQMFAVFWAIVVTSKAIHYRNRGKNEMTATPDSTSTGAANPSTGADPSASESRSNHRNIHARNFQLKFNWGFQLAVTILTVVLTVVILFVVAYGVQSGVDDRRILIDQKTAGSLWCAPVYVLCVYLGFRATTYGENASLISFLVVNCLQLVLCSFECATSVFACINGPYTLNVILPTVWPTYWPMPMPTPMPTMEPDIWRFLSPLLGLHFIIIVAAILHFCLSIWGIVAASKAANRDGACDCGGCNCGAGDCRAGNSGVTSVPYVVQVVTPTTPTTMAGATQYILVPANGLGATGPVAVANPIVAAPAYNYVGTNAVANPIAAAPVYNYVGTNAGIGEKRG